MTSHLSEDGGRREIYSHLRAEVDQLAADQVADLILGGCRLDGR
jgi:hypothetical protein